jgi:hypothetical protein
MAIRFVTSSNFKIDVVVTCDDEVQASDEQRSLYLSSGDLNDLESVSDKATRFTIKALSPAERERAEVQAGAYTRSELGRLLWLQAPASLEERARWHHELHDDERQAYSEYTAYINRVYIEMIRESLQAIDGESATVDQLEMIRPDSVRTETISELVLHVQRISLLDSSGK